MKKKYLLLISLTLLILSVGAVSADDGQNQTLETSFEEVDDSNSLSEFDGDELEQSCDSELLKGGAVDDKHSIGVEDTVIYGSGRIQVDYDSATSGDLFLTVNGKEYKVDKFYDEWGMSTHGFAKINNDLAIGNYTAIVKYMGDKKIPQYSQNFKFEIVPKILAPDTVFNENGEIYLKLPENAAGALSIQIGKIIDGQENWIINQTISLNKGIASYSLGNIEVGKYKLKAKYNGSDYNVKELSSDLSVNPDIYVPSKIVRGDDNVIVKIPGFSGTIVYYVPGADLDYDKLYAEAELTNGIASLNLRDVSTGKFTLPLTLHSSSDNQDYNYKFVIDVQCPTLKASNVNVQYNSYYKVRITGLDKDINITGDKVTFKIGKKVIGTGKVDKNGYASIRINQKPGSYKITAIYNTYHKITKKVNVKHIVTLKKVKVKKSAKRLVLHATLKMGKTPLAKKRVTFKFNGKTFKKVTNKNGIAKVTIKKSLLKKLKVGKRVTYQAGYGKDIIKYTVKVKR